MGCSVTVIRWIWYHLRRVTEAANEQRNGLEGMTVGDAARSTLWEKERKGA